jgi:hypothetical protein
MSRRSALRCLACSLDDAGRDGPAFREGLAVAQVLVQGTEVAGVGVRTGSPAGGARPGGDLLRGPGAIADEYRERLGRDPVLGAARLPFRSKVALQKWSSKSLNTQLREPPEAFGVPHKNPTSPPPRPPPLFSRSIL